MPSLQSAGQELARNGSGRAECARVLRETSVWYVVLCGCGMFLAMCAAWLVPDPVQSVGTCQQLHHRPETRRNERQETALLVRLESATRLKVFRSGAQAREPT
eukprot:2155188-Rhodomonas_salina.2